MGVDELDAAFGAGDHLLEAGDFAVELDENAVAGEEFGGGVDHHLDFGEFGREGVGAATGVDGERQFQVMVMQVLRRRICQRATAMSMTASRASWLTGL